jgi:hypothetical protein
VGGDVHLRVAGLRRHVVEEVVELVVDELLDLPVRPVGVVLEGEQRALGIAVAREAHEVDDEHRERRCAVGRVLVGRFVRGSNGIGVSVSGR